jgi:hypothetical protein
VVESIFRGLAKLADRDGTRWRCIGAKGIIHSNIPAVRSGSRGLKASPEFSILLRLNIGILIHVVLRLCQHYSRSQKITLIIRLDIIEVAKAVVGRKKVSPEIPLRQIEILELLLRYGLDRIRSRSASRLARENCDTVGVCGIFQM